ncbi:MAG: hypothetical protein D6834_00610 [Aquificota bacterium]|nr:MAG: hypothetical protein D6834_00610 [Aquificota bacterium]
MNKTTREFIDQYRGATSQEEKQSLIEYLKFDHRIQLEELQENLSEEEYQEIINTKPKTFDLESHIEMRLTDECYELAYRFFRSKYGQKIVKAVAKRVRKELEDVPEAFHKRETDRIISYKITFKEIFQKSFPLFLKYLTKIKLL